MVPGGPKPAESRMPSGSKSRSIMWYSHERCVISSIIAAAMR